MDSYSVSQVAERTGFTPSTLRFYDDHGLVSPGRASNGYRTYDTADVERLQFIARAKRFGLTLDEITHVLALLDDDRCAPVQGHMRDLVDAKIADTQTRIGDLVAFAAELQRMAATLRSSTPDGPCDATCGCTSDPERIARHETDRVGVVLTAGPSRSNAPIACTLTPERVGGRIADWQALLGQATDRTAVEGGVRSRFASSVDVAELAALAAAEHDCCQFFTFAITIDRDGVTLDITGPPDARPVIDALAGVVA